MNRRELQRAVWAAALVTVLLTAAAGPQASNEQVEESPQQLAFPGEFVRLVQNDEGFVVLGYRVANDSIGQEWMLLETGMTLDPGVETITITRDALFIETPDGSKVPLATQEEFRQGHGALRALDKRASIARDPLDYLPSTATTPCAMRFFSDLSGKSRQLSFDQLELGSNTRCFGRIYFRLPDGIQLGQYFFNVQLRDTTVRVPFRIMTKDELKEFKAELKQMKKEAKKRE
jgi:hypothetical protein